jgi:hypothetical protein
MKDGDKAAAESSAAAAPAQQVTAERRADGQTIDVEAKTKS